MDWWAVATIPMTMWFGCWIGYMIGTRMGWRKGYDVGRISYYAAPGAYYRDTELSAKEGGT